MARNLNVAVQPAPQMPAGFRPRWIFTATKLVGLDEAGVGEFRRTNACSAKCLSVKAAHCGSRSFVDRHEDRHPLRRIYRRAEALPRRFHDRLADQQGRARPGWRAAKTNAEPAGPDAAHIKAQDQVLASGKKLVDQEKFKREEHPFDAYPRLKQQALTNAPPSPADNFRWRYYGLFYVAPGAGFLHVPPADSQRHSQALAVRGTCRSRRAAVRPFLPCHDPRQSSGARNSAKERGRADRGHSGSRPVLARFRRRQYSQRHGHADGRHRSAGTDRHPRICARMALSYSQRPLALRPAAQVQRRVRRRGQDRGAGRHQRHRLRRR